MKKIKFRVGDILSAYITSEWDNEVGREERAIVEKEGNKYWAKSIYTCDWHELDEFNWEIIGSVHKNPELLIND